MVIQNSRFGIDFEKRKLEDSLLRIKKSLISNHNELENNIEKIYSLILDSILNLNLDSLKSIYNFILKQGYEHPTLLFQLPKLKFQNLFHYQDELIFKRDEYNQRRQQQQQQDFKIKDIFNFFNNMKFISKHFFNNIIKCLTLSKEFSLKEKEKLIKGINFTRFPKSSLKIVFLNLIHKNFNISKLILSRIIDNNNNNNGDGDDDDGVIDIFNGFKKSYNEIIKIKFEQELGRDKPYIIIKKNLKSEYLDEPIQEEELGDEHYEMDSMVNQLYEYDEVYYFIDKLLSSSVLINHKDCFQFVFEHLFNLILQSKQCKLELLNELIEKYKEYQIKVPHGFYQIFNYLYLKSPSLAHFTMETWDLFQYGYFRVNRYLNDSHFTFDYIYNCKDCFELFAKLSDSFIETIRATLYFENPAEQKQSDYETLNENCIFLMDLNLLDYFFRFMIHTQSTPFLNSDSLYFIIMKFDNIDRIEEIVQFLLFERSEVTVLKLLEVAIESGRIETVKYLLSNYLQELTNQGPLKIYYTIFQFNNISILNIFLSNETYKSLLALYETNSEIQYSGSESFKFINGTYEKDFYNKSFKYGYLSICKLLEEHYSSDNNNNNNNNQDNNSENSSNGGNNIVKLKLKLKTIEKAIQNDHIEIIKYYYLNYPQYKYLIKYSLRKLKPLDFNYFKWLK
ncbi:hypothetical protein ACTFIW_011926 [Dictyostelium discoideum]